jgi:ABC-type dipeptide/oligopeptide/nickel transport system permease subunit
VLLHCHAGHTPLGAIAGFAGGWVDEIIMRITDMFLAFPRSSSAGLREAAAP